jgi:hypothetical protein
MKRLSKGRAKKKLLTGGPWHGGHAMLRGETMVFRVGNFKGRYLSEGRWVNVL